MTELERPRYYAGESETPLSLQGRNVKVKLSANCVPTWEELLMAMDMVRKEVGSVTLDGIPTCPSRLSVDKGVCMQNLNIVVDLDGMASHA